MKRILSIFIVLIMLVCTGSAETIVIDMYEERGIQPADHYDLNEIPDGYSPTTGRKLSDYVNIPEGYAGYAVTGRYMPMLVQIDNTVGGTGSRAPWGTEYADIVYETPLYETGITRLSYLYSDVLPDYVGPVRSTRVEHVWLREEWDCGFCYYGQQEYNLTNVPEQFRKYGASSKGVLFSGTVGSGKAWKRYYKRHEGLVKVHSWGANIAAMSTLIPEDHRAASHAFAFTDTATDTDDKAYMIHVDWGNTNYSSLLEYDDDDGCWYRYLTADEMNPVLYSDLDTGKAVTFSNVIVQFIECRYVSSDAPLPEMTGTGNADFFIGNNHCSGMWKRDSIQERTVFIDENGNEIRILPGRTLIITIDAGNRHRSVCYERE